MDKIWDYIFFTFDKGYWNYLWGEITNPNLHNYFYWLILVSLLFGSLEFMSPWRKQQKFFRKDFWLDAFYMFFNFFIFSLIIYNAASNVVVNFFNDAILSLVGINLAEINPLYQWPLWGVLVVGFFVRDFVQWWTHRLLHRFEFLWNFHKVHHSVEEMGFAAHLRYHWMETIVYRSIEYIPLALIGIGLYDFFIIHIFTLAIGHYNHSNINIPDRIVGGVIFFLIGLVVVFGLFDFTAFDFGGNLVIQLAVLGLFTAVGYFILSKYVKYIFNSPQMHIWHHAEYIPDGFKYGVNYGITLSMWDYIFGTAAIPTDGRDIKLGFEGVEQFPKKFLKQEAYGLLNK